MLTHEQRDMITKLHAEGHGHAAIARQLGLTYKQVSNRVARERMKVHEREIKRALGYPDKGPEIPHYVWTDRDRRLSITPRDITAALMGDPLPGMSALERRA